ncbi:MAG: efflux RND transporter periplasmic adaptor subunit [Phycisphaerales bacterium]
MSRRSNRLPRTLIAFVVRTVVALIVLAIAVGIFQQLKATRPAPGRVDTDAERLRVPVLALDAVPVRRTWVGYGTARAMNAADVPARVAATVASIPASVEEGAPIDPGAVLAQLDDRDFRAAVEAARQRVAELDARLSGLDVDARVLRDQLELADERVTVAQNDLRRVQEASDRGAARDREIDAAISALSSVRSDRARTQAELDRIPSARASVVATRASALADVSVTELALERTVIVNPFGAAGEPGPPPAFVIQSMDVEPGESVVPGQRVARIVDPGRLEIPIRVPASARRTLGPGDPVALYEPGDPPGEPSFQTTIARIAPEDSVETRTTLVYAELRQAPNDLSGLAPGRFVRAEIAAGEPERRVIVPRRSLDGDRMLIVGEGGMLRQIDARPLYGVTMLRPETGLPDTDWVVLADPPPDGTQVVLSPSRRLVDGRVVDPAPVRERVNAAEVQP